MISSVQLQTIFPLAQKRIETFISPLQAAMDETNIATPPRQAAFLAQVRHESAELARIQSAIVDVMADSEVSAFCRTRTRPPAWFSKRWNDTAWQVDVSAVGSLIAPYPAGTCHLTRVSETPMSSCLHMAA